MKKGKILIVEDSPSNAMLYENYLSDYSHVSVAYNGEEALALFEKTDFDLILLDVQLPDMSGIDILKTIRKKDRKVAIIMVTAHGSVDIALEAMKNKANDFLAKPFEKARLVITVSNLLKEHELADILEKYESSCARDSFERMVGRSLPMQSVYNTIENSANSKATVFITGESGTGKELCAEAIHRRSNRSDQEFVALNCAAIPKDLIESEIFGHIKGAFTGASSTRKGAADKANGGTLFLDEIGEMPIELQSKLLRFIQTGKFQAIGSNKEVTTDIRFVCATNRDPLQEIKNGRFREDLYYRLNVIPIDMPPLRQRGDDIILLAQRMLEDQNKNEGKKFQEFTPEVRDIFMNYPWPGNVRELGNVIQNIVVLNEGKKVSPEMLPFSLTENGDTYPLPQRTIANSALRIPEEKILSTANESVEIEYKTHADNTRASLVESEQKPSEIRPLWLAEKEFIESAIAYCDGNIPKAAVLLEISASTIYRKKQQWETKIEKA